MEQYPTQSEYCLIDQVANMVSCPVHLIIKALPQARINFSSEEQSELFY